MTTSGTVKVTSDGTTKTLIVKGSGPPPKVFANPEAWVWDLVRDNAGAAITVTYDETVGPPVTTTITNVEVG